jgi:hypothetical protein
MPDFDVWFVASRTLGRKVSRLAAYPCLCRAKCDYRCPCRGRVDDVPLPANCCGRISRRPKRDDEFEADWSAKRR